MKFKTILATATVAFLASSSHAAITISSNNSGSGRQITTSTGTPLATGAGSMRIGYFLDANSPVLRSGDWTAINAVFIPLGEGGPATLGVVTNPVQAPGPPIPVPSGATAGRYNGSIGGITGSNAAVDPAPNSNTLSQGVRLFLFASNSPDPKVTAPSQFALVSDDVLWRAPKDDPLIPGGASVTMALNLANISDASDIFHGTVESVAGTNFLRLALPIPEPGTTLLGLVAAAGLIARRRR